MTKPSYTIEQLRELLKQCDIEARGVPFDDYDVNYFLDWLDKRPAVEPAVTNQRGYIRSFHPVQIAPGAPVLVTISFECEEEQMRALAALAEKAIRANMPVALELSDEPSHVHDLQPKDGLMRCSICLEER